MTKTPGVPRIESELLIGMALLQWSARQLSDYASAIGRPVAIEVIENGMGMSMSRFSLNSNSTALANLQETLATVGIGFAHEVFGVVRTFNVRLVFGEDCRSATEAIGVLLQNLATPKITLTVQSAKGKKHTARSLALVIETSNGTRLLYDAGPVASDDLEAIVTLLYATWLARLDVATTCVANRQSMTAEAAIEGILASPVQPAASLSKARTLQLLSGEDCE